MQSRGRIHIKSADPYQEGDFECGFLEHPADLPVHVWVYKKSREIARRMPAYRGEVPELHPKFPKHSEAYCQVYDITEVPKYGFDVVPKPTTSKPPPVVKRDIQYTAEDDRIIEDWIRSTITSAQTMSR